MYIDGYNFYYALKKNTIGWPLALGWCDFECLAKRHLIPEGGGALGYIKYFTAKVGAFGSKKGDLGGEAMRQELWLRTIQSNPKVEVVYGEHHGKYDPDSEVRARHREEKQTDVNLALALAFDAAQNKCSRAILVTADTDQIPAIKAACKWGKAVEVWLPPGGASPRWQQAFADRQEIAPGRVSIRVITRNMLEDCRLPENLPSAAMPRSWRLDED